MLIGIISDTHDHAKNLLKAIDVLNDKKVELVIHCGDWVAPFMPNFCKDLNCKMWSIFGNNEGDIFRFMDRKDKENWNIEFYNHLLVEEVDGRQIAAYHGQDKKLLETLIKSEEYDAVFSGHTHEVVNEQHGKTLHLNPGTLTEYSNSQIADNPTLAIYDTKTNTAEIIKLK